MVAIKRRSPDGFSDEGSGDESRAVRPRSSEDIDSITRSNLGASLTTALDRARYNAVADPAQGKSGDSASDESSEVSDSSEESSSSSEEEEDEDEDEDMDDSSDDEVKAPESSGPPRITERDKAKFGSLRDRMKNFMPQMAKANEELEAERVAGTLHKRNMEAIDEDGRHVEMNLYPLMDVLSKNDDHPAKEPDEASESSEDVPMRDSSEGAEEKPKKPLIQELD